MIDQGRLAELLAISPVIPVLTIEDVAHAVPLARALLEGGIGVVEVTLRTRAGLPAMAAMVAEVPGMVVGAGTVLTAAQYRAVDEIGAQFVVSPGSSPLVLEAAARSKVPFLPGAATPTEVLHLLEGGYLLQKFFPAEPAGGIPMLKAIGAPITDVRFCPTGGITLGNARDYLALANVVCVGGSWLTPADAMHDGDWRRITALAAEAAALKR
ncbi:MAG: keto-deoxy-phosphogluconate aldolase [Acidiphilium sp. 37-64-53]|uniref:bifunctional 4-hydroxy-2-oxoglutarate aldolase/2-dehydro-3-deoxy-phosphogluconate aldolase n=1 Tax=Acidiphilium TaxID=522 RepID=UPI000BD46C77|nr:MULTISPECIES: bifunctional 4-hydroxy-2-oxoglutarate aldolase/2-dehydro-3-deoxy-phosphogluconate aldolase [Acidiphilium]OYW01604.1 MAG: keto-deoxy-phosphogluconate aldolase [Acidiphilium sp. 37-64-53]OZB29413.1 MAG: keto-deoxy-phosphogluconate aldolase [Acidiphilium sp. 34-64-41]HQT83726.1 bifunctional 4-hydroxy-2-oxoglutarate aldolase/2-dehydro-3-deoxy-phosphogluconate aldolase [Acidiphilium rubrum]